MADVFRELNEKEDLKKSRLLFTSALVCSFIFYYFMVRLSPERRDFVPGRIGTAIVATVALLVTFFARQKILITLFIGVMFSYVFLYIYLLHINDWSVFHRWSYFVVGAIFCASAMSWRSYLFTAAVSIVAPIVAGFYSSLSPLELIHFHAANFTVFFVIGVSVNSVFRHKAEVMTLTKSLVQTSKMAALGEMAGGIAHEINTPLSIIVGNVDLIKSHLSGKANSDVSRVNALLDRIETTAFRISQIIQGLRHFSREASSDKYEAVDLRDIIAETLQLCQERFKIKQVHVMTELPSFPVVCNCQKVQITQILLNLLNNAYDACHKLSDPTVRIKLERNDIYAMISVRDNGPGVPPELDSKIMQPFFTTKEVGKGTGLGLSVSLGIATAHEGYLYLDRQVSPSCFVLKLPLTRP